MRGRVLMTVLPALLVVVSCSRPSATTPAHLDDEPVIRNEVVVGRVSDGRVVWLATAANALVRVDLERRSHERVPVTPLSYIEKIWGLAATADGRMWTLVGRHTLAEVGSDGAIRQRIKLREPTVGLYGITGRLVYQELWLDPPLDALSIGDPGSAGRRRWSHLRTRPMALPRAETAAINLVSCGVTGDGRTPCWFPEEPRVTLTAADGTSVDVTLEGVASSPPAELLQSSNPRRPVRDVVLAPEGHLWVIVGSGANQQADERPGGWELARFDLTGKRLASTVLPQPARLILAVDGGVCTLLASDGRLMEVTL